LLGVESVLHRIARLRMVPAETQHFLGRHARPDPPQRQARRGQGPTRAPAIGKKSRAVQARECARPGRTRNEWLRPTGCSVLSPFVIFIRCSHQTRIVHYAAGSACA
jgi:hypothetical protein